VVKSVENVNDPSFYIESEDFFNRTAAKSAWKLIRSVASLSLLFC